MSNLIFARRLIQRVIVETRQSLGVGPTERIMERINLQDSNSLAAMWELIILHALSKGGELQHEVELSNHRRPDIDIHIGGTKFVGDVATVSDAGLDKLNPAEPVREAITRSARKHGVNPNKISIKIGGRLHGGRGKTRMLLSLPHRGEIGELIDEKLMEFFLSVKKEPSKSACTGIDTGSTRIAISYEPRNEFQNMSFPSYTTAFSTTKNPIWNALSEKARQLCAATNCLRVIILCDGGCDLFRQRSTPSSFDAGDILREFFRQHDSIALVVLVTVEEYGGNYAQDRKYRLRVTAMRSGCGAKGDESPGGMSVSFLEVLRAGLATLPEPIQTPRNAAIRLREPGFGPDMIGGYVNMGGHIVRISVRALQRLLAGTIEYHEFAETYGWGERTSPGNPFLGALARGKMIVRSAIVKEANNDDDWIEFEFGDDAAVSKFRLPE